MRTLILTIETVGDEWDSLDEETQSILTSWIRRRGHAEQEQALLTESVKDRLKFSPFTGKILAMSLFDVGLGTGVVYHTVAILPHEFLQGDFTYKYRTEHEMLEDFWEGVHSYERIITFHGSSFCIPFLRMRSIAKRISPSVVFAEYSHASREGVLHVDLASPYGYGTRGRGRVSLRIVARAVGVVSGDTEGENLNIGEVALREPLPSLLRDVRDDTLRINGLFAVWKAHLSHDDEEE
jgi:DNA polymerase elongation subunit (family B)